MDERQYGIRGKQLAYYVQRSPRGAVVMARHHVVTEEIKEVEAEALVTALNAEYETRMKK